MKLKLFAAAALLAISGVSAPAVQAFDGEIICYGNACGGVPNQNTQIISCTEASCMYLTCTGIAGQQDCNVWWGARLPLPNGPGFPEEP